MTEPVPLAEAERMLAAIASVQDAVTVRDFAEAARVAAKQGKLGTGSINYATVVKLRAERLIAEYVDQGQAAGQIATMDRTKGPDSGPISTLDDLGLTKQRVAEARTIRDRYDDAELIQLGTAATAEDRLLSRDAIVRQAELQEDRDAKLRDDWNTPRWLFDQLGVTFDLDVCAPIDRAHRTVPARRYYTQQDDGLTQPWAGLVWCNPPYSAPQPWMRRWAEHDNGMFLSVVSAKTGRMAPHWRSADRLVMFAGMIFDRPDGSTEAPYLPLTLAARGTAADLLKNIDHKWAGPVLERVW